MNHTLYKDLVEWVEGRRIRVGVEEWQKTLITTTGRHYHIKEDGKLYRRHKNLSIPVIKEKHKNDIIKLAHDHPLSGHMGRDNTIFRLQEAAWWPGMRDDIIDYIKRCDTCQKRSKNKDTTSAQSAHITGQPFIHIGIDVMGPLPITTTGKRYIILAVDFFTKYLEGVAVEEADAQTV